VTLGGIVIGNHFVVMVLLYYHSAKKLVKGEPNVSYICSRYYRAPELIFGATDYTVDIGMTIILICLHCVVTRVLMQLEGLIIIPLRPKLILMHQKCKTLHVYVALNHSC